MVTRVIHVGSQRGGDYRTCKSVGRMRMALYGPMWPNAQPKFTIFSISIQKKTFQIKKTMMNKAVFLFALQVVV